MAKYILKFTKEGYFKYTSHLDLLRFFKRTFKRHDIRLSYSQGFNPHPKLGFAQPLSLGYSSIYEILEFETQEDMKEDEILTKLTSAMPEGLNVLLCQRYDLPGKSLAALTIAANYSICIPVSDGFTEAQMKEAVNKLLSMKEIIVKKKQKKKKELVDVDIRQKIRSINAIRVNGGILLDAVLDAGSDSNLSPELLLDGFLPLLNEDVPRYNVEIMRKKITFSNGFEV